MVGWFEEGTGVRGLGYKKVGFVDSTNRAYPELIDAAKATHKHLLNVHSGMCQTVKNQKLQKLVGRRLHVITEVF
jgi:hypothetical protein